MHGFKPIAVWPMISTMTQTTTEQARILVFWGIGGFTAETRHLANHLERRFALYHAGPLDPQKIPPSMQGRTYFINPLTGRDTRGLLAKLLRSGRVLAACYRVIRTVRPRAILCVGHATSLPACLAARLTGVTSIFVETMTRPDTLSRTGRALYRLRLPGRFYVQWPQQQTRYPRAHYGGIAFDFRDSRHV